MLFVPTNTGTPANSVAPEKGITSGKSVDEEICLLLNTQIFIGTMIYLPEFY